MILRPHCEWKNISMPINLTVELYGNSRIITGQKLIQLKFAESKVGAADVIKELGLLFPSLDGKVLDIGRKKLLSSYVFNLNGVAFQGPPKLKLRDGDSLLILPSQAGG